ncbi:MAG TPA: hypothetical protein PLL20_14790, partial [Phycisphaerae bacterium]|nr:hypothetical protein [Phycisphaerae bacterium]HRR84351.1 hypothetical protein [Phycisphaerae bacterium]
EQNDRSEGFRQPRYDWDHDCDIDQVDFARWQYCLGRQEPQQSLWDDYLCVELDSNDDRMVSIEDWDAFEANATGAGISYNPKPPPASSSPLDPCETPENYFTITAWRSVRTHGTVGPLGITLDPDAAPDSAVIEPRQGDVQIIEVDLAQPAYPWTDLSFVYVTGSDASQPWPMSYDFVNNDQTFRLFFDATDPDNRLNDQVCYTIDLSDALISLNWTELECDADCSIRMLAADVDGDVTVEETDDEGAIEAANGQTAGESNMRLDIDTDGTITGTETTGADWTIVHALLDNTVVCSGGSMTMGISQSMSMAERGDQTQELTLLALLQQQLAAGLLSPTANVSARWVVHGTGATSVTLPAGGGTVAVDLVVATDAPIWGLEGRLAVDAANVVSINSADWTELDNVLFSHRVDGHNQSSYYDLTVMDWLWARMTPDGSDVIDSGTDVEALLAPDPPTAWTLTNSLATVDGAIATPAGDLFTTTASIGGATRQLLPVGQTAVATLSLTISGTPGTYHLTLNDGSFINEDMASVPMVGGPELEIIVGQ